MAGEESEPAERVEGEEVEAHQDELELQRQELAVDVEPGQQLRGGLHEDRQTVHSDEE